ncbi:extracellular solute-binding protein [Streptomyces sp. NPDC003011]
MRLVPKPSFFAGLVAATMVLMTGCSGDSSGDDQDVTLHYWATQQSASITSDEAILEKSLNRFTQQTGIKVDVEVIPFADLLSRILSAVSSGDGPDVLNIGNTWAPTLQQTGAFVEFDDDTLKKVGGKERFVPAALDSTGVAGETPTSVPLYSNVYSLYYNPKLFKAAGIKTPPKTWDEFGEDARKLTVDTDGDGSIDQYGLAVAGASDTVGPHMMMIWGAQLGGTYLDKDGQPSINGAPQRAAAEQYIDLLQSGVTTPASAEIATPTVALEQLINGKVAMTFQTAPRATLENRKFTDWAMTPMPVPADIPSGGGPVQSFAAGTNISVSKDSDHVDAALQLVKHLTSPTEQVHLSTSYGLLPSVTAAYDDPAIAEDEYYQARYKILRDNTIPAPMSAKGADVETAVGAALKDLVAQAATKKNVDEAAIDKRLDAAQKEAESK